MSITKVSDLDLDGVEYGDPCVIYINNYLGLNIGDEFSKGFIKQICIHPESECAWLVISGKGATYEADVPYEEFHNE